MQVLGFTTEERETINKLLASVLHLGNVYFHRKQLKHGQEGRIRKQVIFITYRLGTRKVKW